MILSLLELLYLILTVLVIGYIFTGTVQRPRVRSDLDYLVSRFSWDDFWYACLVASPGIILHELAHQFVALSFGLSAVYQVWPTGLFIGVLLKLLGSGFMLLAPGYVSILGGDALSLTFSAFAGPFMNLLLWFGAWLYLRLEHVSRRGAVTAGLLKQINLWLFIFNMLPLPPLDGSKVFFGLYQLLFV